MKKLLYIPLILLLVALLISADKVLHQQHISSVAIAKNDIIGCGTFTTDIVTDANGKFIPLLPGLGNHSFTVSTSNDSAQLYFNQGLNFYYSYHLKESLASFKEAARFDTNCAMAYWGQALSMGPYYNNYYYKMGKEVPATIQQMNSHIATATAKEKALINAMQQRYSADTTNSDRVQLDSSYAASMRLLTQQYPDDVDIKALYIDGVMLQHKWDFWYNNGKPKQWTPELVALCEEILQKEPTHPAALHYYIHLTEASKHPEVALHSAEVLKEVMPGAGHMVHMATHEYQRNGLFAQGVYVNELANTVYNTVDSLAPALGIGRNKVSHIFNVQSYCAMNAGMYNKAMPVYLRTRNSIELNPSLTSPANTSSLFFQGVYMTPIIAMVRMGKWQDILASPAPDTTWKYATLLDAFARGLAYVHNNDLPAAKRCLSKIETILPDSLLQVRLMPINKPVQSGKIAAGILKGELLYAQGKKMEAITAFKEAVTEEDSLIYSEPPEWRLPARQYLGAYLLKMNNAKEAEQVYREDLIWNRGNGWSLIGLYNALLAQRKTEEADKYKTLYIAAFKDADVVVVNSVF
jgi:hypothetical protein